MLESRPTYYKILEDSMGLIDYLLYDDSHTRIFEGLDNPQVTHPNSDDVLNSVMSRKLLRKFAEQMNRIRYKPNVSFSWYPVESFGDFQVRIYAKVVDARDNSKTITIRSAVLVSKMVIERMTKEEEKSSNFLTELIFRQLRELENHETCEFFQLDGEFVKDPHK